jgi:iron complex transport system permease protein
MVAVATFRRRPFGNGLLLAGVAVGYALSAATSFLIFASDSAEGSRSVMFWLLGSLALARWDAVLVVVLVVVAVARRRALVTRPVPRTAAAPRR